MRAPRLLDRRELLAAGLGAALASGCQWTSTVKTDSSDVASGWIDAHSHIWTRDVKRFPLAGKQTVADLHAVSAMCRRHPDTPVVIDHFARVGVTGKIEPADVAALCGLARHKRVRVKVSAFYALGKKKPPYVDLKPMIRQVVEAFGPS